MDKQQPLTAEAMQKLDHWAIHELGIPSIVLMEQAGSNVAHVAEIILLEGVEKVKQCNKEDTWPLSLSPGTTLISKKVVVVCGKGNNGGDGFVVARKLALKGASVTVVLLAEPRHYKENAAHNLGIVQKLGIPVVTLPEGSTLEVLLREADLIVDAIFGTGFSPSLTLRGLRKPLRAGLASSPIDSVIRQMKQSNCLTLSIDIPSGLHGTTGIVETVAVKADVTVALHAMKTGFLLQDGPKCCGEIVVVDIGIPYSHES